MRTRVKICGITRVEDAAAAVDAGADAIGLVFYDPSPRSVAIQQAVEICQAIPAFVTVTALFVDAPVEQVRDVLSQVPVDLLQFHGDESPQYCRSFSRPYIKAIRVREGLDVPAFARQFPCSKALLLDAYRPGVPGGTGETFDWGLIPENLDLPVILAGGLNPDNIESAVAQVRPFAVDVSGGVEAAKGIKDSQLVNQFIKEVSCADQR
ncbi:phosphoribosylanthranilate isomerase [Motiliproteus sp. MSK22-1]|uniref:phosphoribosylanthranilate isomerase n=1 Tax=Motiliproteus sp. MSK22-1 TaxID=1897630 RepID=UPI000975D323|nr:phosphoribosylanthranilate isomerase [Motiliproteus sp. MSK22-1]OMH38701.1 N-(5'-phosphoribosyl)anthranilate isomerase [Motiliproteus sp. MSK22-1]